MGKDKETVFEQVKKCNELIEKALRDENIDLWCDGNRLSFGCR